LILDLDSSEDPAHCRQEGVNSNGHYRKNCYHPLFCFTSSVICLAGKLKDNLLPGEKVPVRADEGCEKVVFPVPHPPSATVPPLQEGEGYLLDDGFCDFAFGSAQNDRVVWGAGKSISFRTRETNRKEV